MEIRPFKAYRLNPAVVKDVAACIAPPYDLIDDQYQDQLYKRSPYNIIRIEKGKQLPTDTAADNAYTRAAKQLATWIKQRVLVQDPTEAIYAYVQQYCLGDRTYTRYSFIALGKLVPFGPIVRPHEQVFAAPVEDRLRLKRATAAQLGLVFMLYKDQQMVLEGIVEQPEQIPPLLDVHDDQGVRHILLAITRQDQIQAICRMMADKACIIADGHHRYTTGLQYAQESDLPAAGYQMMAFANLCQEGLTVLATHRVVRAIQGLDPHGFIQRLSTYFQVEKASDGRQAVAAMQAKARQISTQGSTAFVVYMGADQVYLAQLRDHQALVSAAPGKSKAWYQLDVAALQVLVIDGILKADKHRSSAGPEVAYVTGKDSAPDQALAMVDSGQYQMAFILNPIRIQQLIDVTEDGLLMPPKSTYFYPKMYTGLTIQRLDEALELAACHDCCQKG